MGFFVDYSLSLRIAHENQQRALEIFNHLHSDEMLQHHARGGSFGSSRNQQPVRERLWYSWVGNPEQPYASLREAFENWGIVDDNVEIVDADDQGAFCISGSYSSKMGQQDFLLEQLAPVLMDAEIPLLGEDGSRIVWVIQDGEFRERPFDDDDQS
jgi:hypothetical protein